MPRRITKWVCVFCGAEYSSEFGAQQCETEDQTKMSELSRTVNRHIRCSNPQCSRHKKPYLRSDWVPKDLSDRPWYSYDGCPDCNSQFEEYVMRESSVHTPEWDKAVEILRESDMTVEIESEPIPAPIYSDSGIIEISEDMLT